MAKNGKMAKMAKWQNGKYFWQKVVIISKNIAGSIQYRQRTEHFSGLCGIPPMNGLEEL
jgi:hypothetical protein